MTDQAAEQDCQQVVRRHIVFGWWSLLAFLSMGLLLETLWAFRAGWYIGESHAMRRLLWTLGHAHGTLFSLIHLAFGVSLNAFPENPGRRLRVASACLVSASILMPGGFFLGGTFMYGGGGDPGLGVFLVPVGGVLLFVAVLLTAVGTLARTSQDRD